MTKSIGPGRESLLGVVDFSCGGGKRGVLFSLRVGGKEKKERKSLQEHT